jgi:tetratricopeptide (TPR) repeat protein
MKPWTWITIVSTVITVAIALLSCLCVTNPAYAAVPETLTTAKTVPFSPAANSALWEKFERLQQDSQLQELVERDMERSITVRAQIQTEVDRAFSHTTTLLNVLLAVLTCLPVLAAVSIWFIRRSVLNQILAETKQQLRDEVEKQLEAEVAAELKQQTEAFQKKIDTIEAELKQQAEAFQKKTETLEAEFNTQLDQLKILYSAAQTEKDSIIQELAQITPSPLRDSASPETQQKIQALTQQLERLQSTSAISFTANDYIEQGKAFYFENRFEDAIAQYDRALSIEPTNPIAWFSKGFALAKRQQFDDALAAYDRALQLKPDFAEALSGRATILVKQQKFDPAIATFDKATSLKPDLFSAWFGKARCYAIQNNPDGAIANLEQAIQLNRERAIEALKADSAFDSLRDDRRFKPLLDLP